jgi:glycine/D-amino acid oxidase-like deaminating enzyme
MEHLIRQASVIDQAKLQKSITIIGAGAVGGWTSFMLAKIGFTNQEVYDFDIVGIENVGPQFFSFNQVGMPKVLALHKTVMSWAKARIRTVMKPWNGDAIQSKIVVSAADSMKVRKDLFEKLRGKDYLFIDSRMGAEMIILHAINCLDEDACANYAKTLFTDAEAAQESCTEKATAYTAGMIGGLITKVIKDWTHGKPYTKTVVWDLSVNNYQAILSN